MVGIYIILAKRKLVERAVQPYLLWSVLFIAYYLIELGQMKEHNYYLIIVIPLLILIVTVGARHIYDKSKMLFLIVLILQPILSAIRIVPSRWMGESTEVPDELYNKESRNRLKFAIPENSHCIVEGDVSGCIWFYFLEKKGTNFSDKEKMFETVNNKLKIETAIEQGIRYLYTNDGSLQDDIRFKNYIEKKIMEEGSFTVYQLKGS